MSKLRWIMLFLALSQTSELLWAQKYRRDCYVSTQARYDCFLQTQNGALPRAQDYANSRNQILEQQAAARPDLIAERNQRRERELQELQQIVDASRQRNISNAGRKYQVNYGIVLEPRRQQEER